ncbi:peroxisomal multifunctional protein [Tieghemostelium lacteum]|uniref:Peroxisomal multifunctional protein n=1 Tax=Tieghemostelium lacteum TaxID=361077 RepID=A0A151Z4K4_TIELA|nr:peroxisomal multifunctional protein [Tieghemostelium lacteum]|eukprot:KYQ88875.1 peroxisomal multifunctional protein [Tieghemostelium lacteum]
MTGELKFKDKVVIVTGAGGGLGKIYALEFAARGAKVVVNDLGGSSTGEGASSKAADVVVNEIKSKGGVAVANYDSVEDGEKIVATAMNNFGRVDILINNAGILRDVSFGKMTDQDWDLVYRVHMKGAYKLTRAVWNHMRDNKFGRVVMTSSAAGLYGNFGQANYGAQKMALVGFANTLAQEGKARNVNVNTIAPVAASRLTESVMPPDLLQQLKPEYIVPLVLYLCHEDTQETGSVFEVGAGWVSKVRLQRSSGVYIKDITAEKIKENWAGIENFDKPQYPTSASDSVSGILSAVSSQPATSAPLHRKPSTSAPTPSPSTSESVEVAGFASSSVFKTIQQTVATNGEELVKKINGIYLFNVKSSGKQQQWTLDLKSGKGSIQKGAGAKPSVTINVEDQDFVDIMSGKLNAQTAFMKGKIKIAGNMGLATKLGQIMQKSKL